MTNREIDILIATKFMKLHEGDGKKTLISPGERDIHGRLVKPAVYRDEEWTAYWYDENSQPTSFRLESYDEPYGEYDPAFSPSERIDDAYIVLQDLVKRIPHADIHIEHHDMTGWQISTCIEEDGWKGWVRADTLPLAICFAALHFVGHFTNEDSDETE